MDRNVLKSAQTKILLTRFSGTGDYLALRPLEVRPVARMTWLAQSLKIANSKIRVLP